MNKNNFYERLSVYLEFAFHGKEIKAYIDELRADLTSYELTHKIYRRALELACKDNVGINYGKVEELLEQARKEIE